MRKLARVVAIAMVAALTVFTLASCAGGGGQGGSSGSSGTSGSGGSAELITVGFAQVGAESDWRIANSLSMRETFTEANGYNLIFEDAQQKPENQFQAVRDFIKQEVDYIVIAPITEAGWDDVLTEAKAAGIPVIIADRMIDTADESLYTCWVGSDFSSEGAEAVSWMEKTFPDKALKIAHIQGTIGSSAQIGRTNGLADGLARNPNWTIVAQESGDFAEATGKQHMERLLKSGITIDVIYCENDNMAFGVMAALNDAHIAFGTGTPITIISFDATHQGLEDTLAGRISLNVECNPLHGPRIAEIIQELENGEAPPKKSYVQEAVFDAATITQAEIDGRDY